MLSPTRGLAIQIPEQSFLLLIFLLLLLMMMMMILILLIIIVIVIQKLLDKPHPFFALVLSPTRELAIQISEQFQALGASISLRTSVLVGGVDLMSQSLSLGKRPHVIVATPGRLLDHLKSTKGFHLKYLKCLVLDEADKLLDQDFENELDSILKVVLRIIDLLPHLRI